METTTAKNVLERVISNTRPPSHYKSNRGFDLLLKLGFGACLAGVLAAAQVNLIPSEATPNNAFVFSVELKAGTPWDEVAKNLRASQGDGEFSSLILDGINVSGEIEMKAPNQAQNTTNPTVGIEGEQK